MIKRTFTLKQIAQVTGISTNRLRIWKKRYGIPKPVSSKGKAHFYDSNTLKYLLRVVKLLDRGHRISDVLEMSEEQMKDHLEASIQLGDTDYKHYLKDEMLQSILELNRNDLQDLYAKALELYGFKASLEELLFPLLNFLGELWENEAVHTIQEHMLSQFIRQKLMVALDHINITNQQPESTLFLPDQELHELPLLYCHYLLLKNGKHSVFLGASVPYKDIEDYLETREPRMVVTYLRYTGSLDYHLKVFPQMVKDFPAINFHFVIPKSHIESIRQLKEEQELDNVFLYEDMELLAKQVLPAES